MDMWTYWTLAVLLVSCKGLPVPLNRVKRVDEYHSKLVRLKEMLQELSDGKLQDSNTPRHESQNKESRRPQILAREPMGWEDTGSHRNQQQLLKQLASRLVGGDRKALTKKTESLPNSLQALERAIEDERTEHEHARADTTGAELGYNSEKRAETEDSSVKQSAHDTTQMHDDIMALLRDFRSRSEVRGHALIPRRRQQQQQQQQQQQPTFTEGYFGDFRHEVLNAVEDRLIKDVRLALHSGFTIKEIINDLQTAQGEWSDTSKRETERDFNDTRKDEIERELETLNKLQNNS